MMPGGRLTDKDRVEIEAGLSERLGYAEVARQLGRPTSTVSREVARNGGRDNYRADRARGAAQQRALRRKATPAQSLADIYGRDADAVRGFVDEFATLMAQTGLSRMASRVAVCLFVTDSGALEAAELAEKLQVSPASVSKAVAYLEALALVRREHHSRRRRERYVVDDDVWVRAWMASAKKNVTWAETAQKGAEILGADTPAGARLENMNRFFTQLAREMAGGSEEMAASDALSVLAAFLHAGVCLTPDKLATVLDWPLERVKAALGEASAGRLTTVQRDALDREHEGRQR
jgi:DNA-binding transcriptional regulator GbsR (MarR family)